MLSLFPCSDFVHVATVIITKDRCINPNDTLRTYSGNKDKQVQETSVCVFD